MARLTFQQWLSTLPALGYDSLWIANNMPALRLRFEQYGDMPMQQAVVPVAPRADRYNEL